MIQVQNHYRLMFIGYFIISIMMCLISGFPKIGDDNTTIRSNVLEDRKLEELNGQIRGHGAHTCGLIKDSIGYPISSRDKDLLICSYSEFHSEDKGTGCLARMENGVVMIDNCTGIATVITFYGTFKFSCGTLTKKTFFGHITIANNNCSYYLKGADLCLKESNWRNNMTIVCMEQEELWLMISLSFLIILMLFLLLVIRLLFIKKMKVFRGQKIINIKIKMTSFVIELDADLEGGPSDSILSHKNRDQFSQVELEEMINRSKKPNSLASKKTINLKFFKCLALIFFVGNSMFNSNTVEARKLQVSTFSTGQVYKNGHMSLSVIEADQFFPLRWVYDTAEFSADQKSHWRCSEANCLLDGDCKEQGPTGWWYTTKVKMNGTGTTSVIRKFCDMNGDTCFTGIGCWKWIIKYIIHIDTVKEVYEFGQSNTKISLNIANSNSTFVVSADLIDRYTPLSSTIIISDHDRAYYCPFESNHKSATPGKLGDLQFNGKGFFSMNWQQSICKASWSDGPRCDTKSSFMNNAMSLCVELPGYVGGYHLSYSKGFIRARKDNNLKVIMEVEDGEIWDESQGDCGIVTRHIYGVKGGMIPYQAVLTSSGIKTGSYSDEIIPCSGLRVKIPCDGIGHVFEIPSIENCNYIDNNVTISEIDDDEMEMVKEVHLNPGDSKHRNVGWSSTLESIGSSTSILGLLGGNGLFLIIILVLIFRK